MIHFFGFRNFWEVALGFSVCMICGCSVQRHPSQDLAKVNSKTTSVSSSKTGRSIVQRGGYLVCLDAGHGGKDGGAAIKKLSLKEKELSLEVVRRTERVLISRGIRVLMTRSQDVYVPLRRRAELANKSACDIFVSVHFNSSSSPSKAGGVEIYYFNNPKQPERVFSSKRLGTCILTGLKGSIGTKSRGVMHGNLCVIRETIMPSVLVEAAFLTNPKEAKLLSSDHFLQQIAVGIASGIEDYFRPLAQLKELGKNNSNDLG